jgi:DNA-directed RNA polymerase subunit RPC12/RpoP
MRSPDDLSTPSPATVSDSVLPSVLDPPAESSDLFATACGQTELCGKCLQHLSEPDSGRYMEPNYKYATCENCGQKIFLRYAPVSAQTDTGIHLAEDLPLEIASLQTIAAKRYALHRDHSLLRVPPKISVTHPASSHRPTFSAKFETGSAIAVPHSTTQAQHSTGYIPKIEPLTADTPEPVDYHQPVSVRAAIGSAASALALHLDS